jgi:predicted peptidase
MFFESGTFEGMNYLIHFPDRYKEGKKYPVLLDLHGAGTRGITLEEYKTSPSFADITRSSNNKLIIVAPHCTENFWYDKYETLARFAHAVARMPFADPTRYYLCGASMGGYTAWQLALSHPTLFAAMIPICGGGMYWAASRLVNLPIWAFHGAKDTTVLPIESKNMVDAITRKGGMAKLTIYPENAHDAWNDTYRNPEVWEWLLSHKNKRRPRR